MMSIDDAFVWPLHRPNALDGTTVAIGGNRPAVVAVALTT
jgi:hypothetical protein